MSKPIKLTDELLESIKEEFADSLKSMKMFSGQINYSKKFVWQDSENSRAVVKFSAVAFAKMVMLLQNFDSEVAWHGVAKRSEECDSEFEITDILVYPQEVTGATVNTDQASYQTWLYSLDDDTFNNIRMQGHSHVNMGVSPSSVDLTHQEQIFDQLDDSMFYIFMIWNKKYEHTTKIYDLKNNTLYENSDIDIYIGNEGIDLDAFLTDAKASVKRKVYTGYTPPKVVGGKGSGINSGYNPKPAQKDEPKTKPKNPKNSFYDDEDWWKEYYGY